MSGGALRSLWAFVGRPKNRTVLSWVGSGVVVAAAGIWAVVTLPFPEKGSPTVNCAQQGSVAAGRDASRNTITITNAGTANSNAGTVACADTTKK